MKTPLIVLIIAAFILTSLGPIIHADEFVLPKPGIMVHLSPAFNPPVLKGIKVHPDNPFKFDFILDKGDDPSSDKQLKEESTKLIKYFLASLTIPEKDLWVNLSPYEKDRIVPESFGQTEMGRDLLAQDYILKQVTASLIYPEDEVGKKFWKRIYEEAAKRFNTTDIPVNTFNKVWIVPEKAVVYENAKAGTAYLVESKLKVMLEQDYLSFIKHEGKVDSIQDIQINQLGSQIVREIVIPELTKEVNEGKNFIHLRQVYNSLIIATWYKKKIKDSILSHVYLNKNKIAGVNIDDSNEKQKIYEQYLKAFKKGVYSYIKEDINPVTHEITSRKYFSGGVTCVVLGENVKFISDVPDSAMIDNSRTRVIQANIIDSAMVISSDKREQWFQMLNNFKGVHSDWMRYFSSLRYPIQKDEIGDVIEVRPGEYFRAMQAYQSAGRHVRFVTASIQAPLFIDMHPHILRAVREDYLHLNVFGRYSANAILYESLNETPERVSFLRLVWIKATSTLEKYVLLKVKAKYDAFKVMMASRSIAKMLLSSQPELWKDKLNTIYTELLPFSSEKIERYLLGKERFATKPKLEDFNPDTFIFLEFLRLLEKSRNLDRGITINPDFIFEAVRQDLLSEPLKIILADILMMSGPEIGSDLHPLINLCKEKGILTNAQANRLYGAENSWGFLKGKSILEGRSGSVIYRGLGYLRLGSNMPESQKIVNSEINVMTSFDRVEPTLRYINGSIYAGPDIQDFVWFLGDATSQDWEEGIYSRKEDKQNGFIAAIAEVVQAMGKERLGITDEDLNHGNGHLKTKLVSIPKSLQSEFYQRLTEKITLQQAGYIQVYRLPNNQLRSRTVKALIRPDLTVYHVAFLGYDKNLSYAFYQIVESGAIIRACIDKSDIEMKHKHIQDIRRSLDVQMLNIALEKSQGVVRRMLSDLDNPRAIPGFKESYLSPTIENVTHEDHLDLRHNFTHLVAEGFLEEMVFLPRDIRELKSSDVGILDEDQFSKLFNRFAEAIENAPRDSQNLSTLFHSSQLTKLYEIRFKGLSHKLTLSGLQWLYDHWRTQFKEDDFGFNLDIPTQELDEITILKNISQLLSKTHRYGLENMILGDLVKVFSLKDVELVQMPGEQLVLGDIEVKEEEAGAKKILNMNKAHFPVWVKAHVVSRIEGDSFQQKKPFVRILIDSSIADKLPENHPLKARRATIQMGASVEEVMRDMNIDSTHVKILLNGKVVSGNALLSHQDNVAISQDKAQVGNDLGGIDLNPDQINLNIQHNDGEIKFHLDPAMLQQFQHSSGFIPVITDIKPLQSIRLFLLGGHNT